MLSSLTCKSARDRAFGDEVDHLAIVDARCVEAAERLARAVIGFARAVHFRDDLRLGLSQRLDQRSGVGGGADERDAEAPLEARLDVVGERLADDVALEGLAEVAAQAVELGVRALQPQPVEMVGVRDRLVAGGLAVDEGVDRDFVMHVRPVRQHHVDAQRMGVGFAGQHGGVEFEEIEGVALQIVTVVELVFDDRLADRLAVELLGPEGQDIVEDGVGIARQSGLRLRGGALRRAGRVAAFAVDLQVDEGGARPRIGDRERGAVGAGGRVGKQRLQPVVLDEAVVDEALAGVDFRAVDLHHAGRIGRVAAGERAEPAASPPLVEDEAVKQDAGDRRDDDEEQGAPGEGETPAWGARMRRPRRGGRGVPFVADVIDTHRGARSWFAACRARSGAVPASIGPNARPARAF